MILCKKKFEDIYTSSEDCLRTFKKEYLEEAKSPCGQGLVLLAVRREDPDNLEKFLKLGLSFSSKPSPFHIAVGRCHLLMVSLFLKYGADVDERTTNDLVALDYLLDIANINPDSEDKCEVVKLLLQNKVDFSKVCKSKLRKLHSSPKILKMLLGSGLDPNDCKHGINSGSLLAQILPNKCDAVCENRLDVIKLLLERTTDLNDQWYLSWSCMNNKFIVVKLLLEACPLNVFKYHDNSSYLQASICKCPHPLCSTIHAFMEFGDDCTECLQLLLAANVRLQWDEDNYSELKPCDYRHSSPFDQFQHYQPVHILPLNICRLLLKSGATWVNLSQVLSNEQVNVLDKEGFSAPRSLQDMARYAIRYLLGPGSGNIIKMVDRLDIPKHLKCYMQLKDVLVNV